MRFACFLALATLAQASPRITQISPASGHLDGAPVAYDIDSDGDLDLAYLFIPQGSVIPGIPVSSSTLSSTWLENLGNRSFSSPKNLGHHFNSSFRVSQGESFLRTSASGRTLLFHHTINPRDNHHDIFAKEITASSWHHVHRFTSDFDIAFLSSPSSDTPFLFAYSSSENRVTYWSSSNGDSLSLAGELEIPENHHSSSDNPIRFQAIDLDQDGDSDLLFELNDQTLIYERTGPLKFSAPPHSIGLVEIISGDLNLDGFPDLTSRQSGTTALINNGDLTFTSTTLPFIPSYTRSSFIGTLGGKATLFNFPHTGQTSIEAYQFDSGLELLNQSSTPTNSINTQAVIVSDFDQDGHSDVAFISSSNPAPRSITTGGRPTTDFIIATRPRYDQALISWGKPGSPSVPIPAYQEAPVICAQPAVGDFNNDGSLDLIVGPDINGQARLMLNDGQGRFTHSRLLTELQPSQWEDGRFDLHDFVPVDLNNDGNLDLSLTITRSENPSFNTPPQSACTIALGDGQGGFSPVTLPTGSFQTIAQGFCHILEFRDWDGDGDLDAILPGAWRENLDGTLRHSAYPLISNADTFDALGNPVSVASQKIADIDGDGSLDILIPALTKKRIDPANNGGVNNGFFTFEPGIGFNSGNGAIEDVAGFPASLLTTDALGNPSVLPFLVLDLNLDGRSEILTAESTTDALGNPFFVRLQQLRLDQTSPRDLSLANAIGFPAFSVPLTSERFDFNGDGELEYVAADQYLTPTTRGPLISPKYNFKGDHLTRSFQTPTAIAVRDFDNDGDTDALYADGFSGLHLVRNTIVDEDSPITTLLTDRGLTPSQATPEADPDNDGRSNALELIHGSDPLVADQPSIEFQHSTLSFDGSHLSFQKRSGASDLALHYDLEVSDDLHTWTRISYGGITVLSTHGIWEKVSVAITRSTRKKYYRISTTHDPRR